MELKSKPKRKFCGNCVSHTPYDYPNLTFCMRRLLDNQNPVVATLWHCKEWVPDTQQCYCVEDAMKKRKV